MENPKMKIILWRNYLLTLKLAYIYQYFTEMLLFLCALSPRKLHRYESIICRGVPP